jgi:hypothetical protein
MKREWRARKTPGQKARWIAANVACWVLEQEFHYINTPLHRLYERLDAYRWARRLSVKPYSPRRSWNGWANAPTQAQAHEAGQDGLDAKLGTKTYAFGAAMSVLAVTQGDSIIWAVDALASVFK